MLRPAGRKRSFQIGMAKADEKSKLLPIPQFGSTMACRLCQFAGSAATKGKFKSQALLCTDLNEQPEQILKWFIMRWQLEVTFHEVRDQLGVETQRQWSDWAIVRTTPALL